MRPRRLLVGLCALVALAGVAAAWSAMRTAGGAPAAAAPFEAEQPIGFPAPPEVEYPDWPYDGRFRFARIRFRPTYWDFSNAYTWGLDLKWNHDYPEAEVNFMKLLDDLTDLDVLLEGGNIMEIDDPRLFEHPWAYLCEPGFWNPTDEQVEILRSYILKGGFLVIDDFFLGRGGQPTQWNNFERQIKRVFPEGILFPIDETHPALRVFFELEDVDFTDERQPWFQGVIYGIFENNDPSKRLLVAINYNMDIGDYWEWSDMAVYPMHLTEKGFKLGINYVMYGLVH